MQTTETHDYDHEAETDHIKHKPKKQRSKKLNKKILSDDFENKLKKKEKKYSSQLRLTY